MTRYLWVDDIREPPCGWMWAPTYQVALKLLERYDFNKISLDHDLGEEMTGYDIVKWLEERSVVGGFVPPIIQVHTANPVGRDNMLAGIEQIRAYSSVG